MYGFGHLYQRLRAECDASYTGATNGLTYTNSLWWKHLKAGDYDVSEYRGVNMICMYLELLWKRNLSFTPSVDYGTC